MGGQGSGRKKEQSAWRKWGGELRSRFTSPHELQEKVDAYFADCDEKKRPYTMAGLSLWLGVSRSTLLDYGTEEMFSDIVSYAREKCEAYVEEMLLSGKNPIGPIFNLKNNYERWKDEKTHDIKGFASLVDLIRQAHHLREGKIYEAEIQPGGNTKLPGQDKN